MEKIGELMRSEKLQKIVYVYFLSVIFCYALMYRIIDSRQVFVFVAPVFIYWMLLRKNSPFDFSFLFLFMGFYFMAVYEFIFQPWMNYNYNVTVYAYFMPIAYFLGKMVVGESHYGFENKAFQVLTVLGGGLFLQGILDYSIRFVQYPNEIGKAEWFSFFGCEGIVRNEVYFEIYMALAAVFFAYLDRQRKKKYFKTVVVAVIIIIFNSLLERSRSVFLMLFLTLLFCIYIYVITNITSVKTKKALLAGTLIFIALFVVYTIVIHFNIFSLGKLYKNSFLGRDGGIFNNIRLKWDREGLSKIFSIQKNGWIVESNWVSQSAHNAFVEYGRNYDIFVFVFMELFIIFSSVKSIMGLIKYNVKCPILYYAVPAQLIYLLYFNLEVIGYLSRDHIIMYIFLCGISSGLIDIVSKGELTKINNVPKRYSRYSDIGLIFLFLSLITVSYTNWWSDTGQVVVTFIIPLALYLLPFITRNNKCNSILFIGATIVTTFISVIIYNTSRCTDLFKNRFCIEVFSTKVVEKSIIIALLCMGISCIVGFIASRLRVNKILLSVLCFVFSILCSYRLLSDGRLLIMKEAFVKAWSYIQPYSWGIPWGVYGMESSDIPTGCNMWLNYSRDYGALTFSFLCIFLLATVVTFIKLVRNNNKTWLDYSIISAYITYSIYLMITDVAYEHKYIFWIYLFVCGLMNTRKESINIEENANAKQ